MWSHTFVEREINVGTVGVEGEQTPFLLGEIRRPGTKRFEFISDVPSTK